MTIQFTTNVPGVGGVDYTAGQTASLSAQTEARLVGANMATWVGAEVVPPEPQIGGDAVTWKRNADGSVSLVGPAEQGIAILIPRRAEHYNVVPDGVALYDVTASNNAICVVQSASGAFTSADVGKVCAVHSRAVAALANTKFGFITSVQSSTQCTAVLNGAPGALTNAMFVYGTDNLSAMQAAITAALASKDKILKLPAGIICVAGGLTAPGNIIMEGAGRSYTEKDWYDFDYAGTSLVSCGYGANGVLYANGNTNGPRLYGFNLDGMGVSGNGLYLSGRAGHVSDLTILKPVGGANNHALKAGPGSMVDHCTVIGGYNCYPLAAGGDSQVTGCNIYGAGTGYFAIKASASGDLIIANNHMWAPGSGGFNSGSILVEAWQSWQDMDSVNITGNQFDTAQNQPHISVTVAAGCGLRGLNIHGNNSFNNNSVTVPYPWMTLNVNATGTLRGLQVTGNMIEGSWDTPASGVHSCLIDGSAIAGSVKGTIVSGNYLDRPSVGAYNAFTPTFTGGNVSVNAAGTETVF